MQAVLTEERAKEFVSGNIRRLLDRRGMRVLRLAEAVAEIVPQNTVYRIVRGESTGSVPALAAIAEALGVTVDYLLTDPSDHENRFAPPSKKLHTVA